MRDARNPSPAGPELPPEELEFRFLGGRVSIDLVATVGERWRRGFERLREPADLGRWLLGAGLVAAPPPVTARELARARALREAIYRLAHPATRASPAPADIALLNEVAGRPNPRPELQPTAREAELRADRPVEAALSAIARDAIDLLCGPGLERVRECAAPDCALLFQDLSRPGRRRWCSMEGCGNRVKTKRYRGKRASADRRSRKELRGGVQAVER